MPLPPSRLPDRAAADWIVLDGYHFDAHYQATIKNSGLNLLALDDFGALDHYAADIIVNQDPIADERLYARRDPHTRLLLGTAYTFLRREFRQRTRPQRDVPALARRLLLTFGGSDPDRLTEMALAEMEFVAVDGLETVVLIGPGNSRGDALEAAGQGRSNLRLLRRPFRLLRRHFRLDGLVRSGGDRCRRHALGARLLPDSFHRAAGKRRASARNGRAAQARGVPVAGPRPTACTRTTGEGNFRSLS